MRKEIDYETRERIKAGAGRRRCIMAIAGFVMLIGMAACSDDDGEGEVPDFPDGPAQVDPGYGDVACYAPVFIGNGVKEDVRTAMQKYLRNIVPLDEASVAIITPAEMFSYDGDLRAFFDGGGLVVIAYPDGRNFDRVSEEYDVFRTIPFDTGQKVQLFAADKTGRTYILYGEGPAEGEEEAEYLRKRYINFGIWLSKQREAETGTNSRAARAADDQAGNWAADQAGKAGTNRAPNQLIANRHDDGIVDGQTIFQNFEIRLNDAVYTNGSTHYDLAASGSVDVNTYILPIYSYDMNGDERGDYYIVTVDIKANNRELYTPLVAKGTFGQVFIGGYYMKEFNITNGIVNTATTKQARATYAWEPNVTPQGNNVYQSVYQLSLHGPQSYDLGLQDGNVAFDCTFTGHKDWALENVGYDVSWSDEAGVWSRGEIVGFNWDKNPVSYEYLNEAIPAAAREDFEDHVGWIWRVGPDEAGVQDNGQARFALTTDIYIKYGSYYYRLLKDKGLSHHSVWGLTSTIALTPPDRRPFGVVAIENRHKADITDISVIPRADRGSPSEAIDVPLKRIAPGETGGIALAEGTYDILYAVRNTGEKTAAAIMQKQGIVVNSGMTLDACTVSLTSDDFSVVTAEFPGLNPYTDGGNPLKK